MSALTDSQLTTLATTIQGNTATNSNAASLVGAFLNDVVDSKINNDKIDTDGTLAANSDSLVASQKATKTYVDANTPKVYVVNITQSGSGAPSINTLIQNDFTGVITLTRASAGFFSATNSLAEFTAGKTEVSIINGINGTGDLGQVVQSTTLCQFSSRNNSGTSTDSLIQGGTLKITVYP